MDAPGFQHINHPFGDAALPLPGSNLGGAELVLPAGIAFPGEELFQIPTFAPMQFRLGHPSHPASVVAAVINPLGPSCPCQGLVQDLCPALTVSL
jgi:hypothetical protein